MINRVERTERYSIRFRPFAFRSFSVFCFYSGRNDVDMFVESEVNNQIGLQIYSWNIFDARTRQWAGEAYVNVR